jgi:hypothetical protein
MANNNRELSQLASLVTVDDTTRNVTIGSTVTSFLVEDISISGVLTTSATGGPLIIAEDTIVNVSGATSTGRAEKLRSEIDRLSKTVISPGVAITIQLDQGEYFFTESLKVQAMSAGIMIVGYGTAGTKPGDTGNHFYNQAGVRDGGNPSANAGIHTHDQFFDPTSPAGSYPNPMVGGQGDSLQSRTYNEGIIRNYYRTRLTFYDCSGIVIEPGGGNPILKDLAVIGVGQTSRFDVSRSIGGYRNTSALNTSDFEATYLEVDLDDDDETDLEVVDEVKVTQLGGGVRVVNCSMLGFYFGYNVGTSGYVSGGSCITNCRIGVRVFRTANVYGGNGKYLNSHLNAQCSQLATFGGSRAYLANSGGINVRGFRGASIYLTNGAKVVNSGSTGVVLSETSHARIDRTDVLSSGGHAIICYDSNINARQLYVAGNSKDAMRGDGTATYRLSGLSTITFNDRRAILANGSSHFTLGGNLGITSNNPDGNKYGSVYSFTAIEALMSSHVNMNDRATIFDNNGSSSGSGNTTTTLQILARDNAYVRLTGFSSTSGANDRYVGQDAVSPDFKVRGNGNAYIVPNRSRLDSAFTGNHIADGSGTNPGNEYDGTAE